MGRDCAVPTEAGVTQRATALRATLTGRDAVVLAGANAGLARVCRTDRSRQPRVGFRWACSTASWIVISRPSGSVVVRGRASATTMVQSSPSTSATSSAVQPISARPGRGIVVCRPLGSCPTTSSVPLAGRLRLRLGELDLVMKAGEVAEFDTHTPHWFGSTGPRLVELLVLFGPQGERFRVRARTRNKTSGRASVDGDT